MKRPLVTLLGLLLSATPLLADWNLRWERELPPRKPAWKYTPRMDEDRAYPVCVQGDLVLVSCEHDGALLALDARSGEERWRFHTEGPLRKAAAGEGERIFLGSEDGFLYALDLSGNLLWKVRGGRSAQKVIAHGRLASAWPVSTRPLVEDGAVYFAAGYWPVEGIFVRALDAETGRVLWTNDTSEFRPFFDPWIEDGKVYFRGNNGSAAFDARTGEELREKLPKRARPELPEAPSAVSGQALERVLEGGTFVVTTAEGGVFCFGEEAAGEPRRYSYSPETPTRDRGDSAAASLLERAGALEGWCVVSGLDDGAFVEDLLRASELRVVAFDPHAGKVEEIRRRLDARGLFDDHRLAVLAASADTVLLPPYMASLVVLQEDGAPAGALEDIVRPYGGVLARRTGDGWKLSRREGALEGTADWRQEFFNAANTLASPDRLVKAPLGVLWYGGPASDTRFYFDGDVDHQSGHGINPQPASAEILEGRLILQGPGLLGAFDIYTGRSLWEAPLPDMYTFGGAGGGLGIHSKKHPEPWKYPEALEYEVKPAERCRASGFNYVSLPGGIWVAAARHLLRFDPATGEKLSAWPVPLDGDFRWGGIRAAGDVLVATLFRPRDMIDAEIGHDGNGGDWAGDRMPMSHLVALDRRDGKLLWSRAARWGYVNRSGFAIGSGKVFTTDLIVPTSLAKLRAAGHEFPDEPPALRALDLETGEEVWSRELELFVRNIAYSAERDLLLVPCRNLIEWRDGDWVNLSLDRRRGRTNKNAPGVLRALRGKDGEVVWRVEGAPYHHPHIVLGDLVVDRYGHTHDLRTGRRHERRSPLTGREAPWSFRKGGCNYLIACENLITWRTAFYDLERGSGVMKLTGLDAGCTPTLLPAGGVLNIPNFGTHHKRNRMTAMALVHRPEGELWTQYFTSREKRRDEEPAPILRAGYNLAAPGDRFAEDGTLWLQVTGRQKAGLRWEPKEVEWRAARGSSADSWIASSAAIALRSLTVPVLITADGKAARHDGAVRRYTVRLHFAELEGREPGERLFDVALEGETVIDGLDIAREAGGSGKALVRELRGVRVEGPLDIALAPRRGETLLSGVELELED